MRNIVLQQKQLPDEKKYEIIPPDMDYVFFANAEIIKFNYKEDKFNLTNAWWLSESSFLAYCHPGFARMAYKLAGLDNFKFFQGKGTECLIAWNKKFTIVSFRGTELNSSSTFHEILTDINTNQIDFDSGKVHKGFYLALMEIWDGENGLKNFLDNHYKKNNSIWVTGHSLGGALATLCLSKLNYIKGAYVYGAPKVGNEDFVDSLKNRVIYRIENSRDPIPLVPLNLPKLNYNFKSAGELKFLNNEDIIEERPINKIESKLLEVRDSKDNFKTALKDFKKYFEYINKEVKLNINDHMPIYYTIKIWNKLVEDL